MKNLQEYINESSTNLKIIATDENIENVVEEQINRLGNNADLNFIDVSKVTNMKALFYMFDFNGDISKWDVSNVTKMSAMFANSKFNKDISSWDISNVIYNEDIFYKCPIKEEYKPKFK